MANAERGMIAVDKMGSKVLFLNPVTYETEVLIDGFPTFDPPSPFRDPFSFFLENNRGNRGNRERSVMLNDL